MKKQLCIFFLKSCDLDVLEKISDVLEDSSLTDVANETQENSTEEGPKVKDLGSSEIFFDQEVSIENLETKTVIANKTQDNSEEENSMVKVELPSVIKTNQQNESNDVAQDRSDVISERMQEIIVGADEGEGENSEGKFFNPEEKLKSGTFLKFLL